MILHSPIFASSLIATQHEYMAFDLHSFAYNIIMALILKYTSTMLCHDILDTSFHMILLHSSIVASSSVATQHEYTVFGLQSFAYNIIIVLKCTNTMLCGIDHE